MGVTRALVDTSVFIAVETARPLRLEQLPTEGQVSVVTVGELRAGVLAAHDPKVRAARLATFERAVGLSPLPVDAAVAESWARLRAALRDSGRRMPVNDSWITATAMAHRLPIVTQDSDYDGIPDIEVIRV